MITHRFTGPGEPRDADWLNDLFSQVSGSTLGEEALRSGGVDEFRLANHMSDRLGRTYVATATVTSTAWTTVASVAVTELSDALVVATALATLTNGTAHGLPAGETLYLRLTDTPAPVSPPEHRFYNGGFDAAPQASVERWFEAAGGLNTYYLQAKNSLGGTVYLENVQFFIEQFRRAVP